MSVLDKNKENQVEASETLTLEDLQADVSEPSMTYTATLHFEFSDILNAIEHIDEAEPEQAADAPVESDAPAEETAEAEAAETAAEAEEPVEETAGLEPADAPAEPDPAEPAEPAEAQIQEPALTPEPAEPEPAPEPEPAAEPEPDQAPAPAEPQPEEEQLPPKKDRKNLAAKFKDQDRGTKRLVLTDSILFTVIAVSIAIGLVAANAIVDKANTANEAKAAEMKANVKEVNLVESLYDCAADQVIEDVAVPTYTLEELYALDLREPTGFTAKDLEMITRKGLVGCEEAFVKAEETYGVNCIFLMSIASLESAYGTQMFRPNNMFGYGRTGFSSKQEGIMTVARGLSTRYLNPSGSLYGGSPTLKGVNKRYAANPKWYYKVGKYMQGYYEELAAEKNVALDKFE